MCSLGHRGLEHIIRNKTLALVGFYTDNSNNHKFFDTIRTYRRCKALRAGVDKILVQIFAMLAGYISSQMITPDIAVDTEGLQSKMAQYTIPHQDFDQSNENRV